MRLNVPNGFMNGRAILEQEQKRQHRARSVTSETPLAIGRPEILCIAYRLFRPVVHVVAEGTSNSFELNSYENMSVNDDEQIPTFLWTEISGKLQLLIDSDMVHGQTSVENNCLCNINERIHVFSARHFGTTARISDATFAFLSFRLHAPNAPVRLDGLVIDFLDVF